MEVRTFQPPHSLVDLLLDAVCVVNPSGMFTYVSPAFQRIFGYAPEEVVGTPMIDYVHPDDREATLRAASEIMAGESKLNLENRYIHKDGHTVHILWTAAWSPADQVRVAVARDITARKQQEILQASIYAISEAAYEADDINTLFRKIHEIIGRLLPASNFSVAMYDPDQDHLAFPYIADEDQRSSPAQATALGAFCHEIVTTGIPLLYAPGSTGDLPPRLAALAHAQASCWMGVPLVSGSHIIGALTLKSYCTRQVYTEKDLTLLQYISTQVVTAIERRQMHDRLQYLAQYDDLTGLPKRNLLLDRIDHAIARARRNRSLVAVAFLDLDNFKQINDTLGHHAGDLLLQQAAVRLQACVRECDTVARLGGDEFVILLENVTSEDCTQKICAKIQTAMDEPYTFDNQPVECRPSLGAITTGPEEDYSPNRLLQLADAAMYAVKMHNVES